ncbi:MAG: hypothetical protein FJ388_18650 [Verrucomicrobia bacterium]|nr:hypothetical protein [Verrucomicrobiota bacterium]
MKPIQLWKRYKKYLYAHDALGLRLDISRMNFTEAFFSGRCRRAPASPPTVPAPSVRCIPCAPFSAKTERVSTSPSIG